MRQIERVCDMAKQKELQAEVTEEKTIEQTFGELEEILAKLEEGECSLEESFQYYEAGMKLVKSCHDKIDRVEKKIIILGEEVQES